MTYKAHSLAVASPRDLIPGCAFIVMARVGGRLAHSASSRFPKCVFLEHLVECWWGRFLQDLASSSASQGATYTNDTYKTRLSGQAIASFSKEQVRLVPVCRRSRAGSHRGLRRVQTTQSYQTGMPRWLLVDSRRRASPAVSGDPPARSRAACATLRHCNGTSDAGCEGICTRGGI